MIGTEFVKGYGLGNQLFFYVVTRCMAEEKGVNFGFINPGQVGNVFHSNKGMYFMDIDLGTEIPPEDRDKYTIFNEQDDRLYMGNSRRDKIKDWLKVKPEAESYEYTSDDLCIINIRGGEYTNHPELYLDRKYFLNAIKHMKKINPDMKFMVVTEDEEAARKVLPEYECHHFDMGKDYVTLKNARYLILSNSSFSIMPVLSSTELKYAIAPKYWARHNISDGFWSSEQNIYSFLHYQDKKGRIFEADECRRELEEYKKRSALYAGRNIRPGKIRLFCQIIRRKSLYGVFYLKKIVRSLEKRVGIIKRFSY